MKNRYNIFGTIGCAIEKFKRGRIIKKAKRNEYKWYGVNEKIYIPESLALPSASDNYDGRGLITVRYVISVLDIWKNTLVEEYFGDPEGRLYINSSYRPAGKAAPGDPYGQIDLTDEHGHWVAHAIDYATDQSRNSFWPHLRNKLWVRDVFRWLLWEAGFKFPWYVAGEFWHVSPYDEWRRTNAYLDKPYPLNGRSVPDNWLELLEGH